LVLAFDFPLKLYIFIKLNAPFSVGSHQNVVPFAPELDTSSVLSLHGKHYYRKQVPLSPAHMGTVHRNQGLTSKTDVVYVVNKRSDFAMGATYVALSRARSIDNLYLANHMIQRNHIEAHKDVRDKITSEYNLLRRRFPVCPFYAPTALFRQTSRDIQRSASLPRPLACKASPTWWCAATMALAAPWA